MQSRSTRPHLPRRSRHPRRARAQGAVAGELDHPQRQPSARERRRAEGRRPPGVVRLARHHHDGALFPRAAAAGPRRGQAARLAELPRHPVSARQADPREARRLPRLQGRAEPIRRAPRTPTTSISPPARSASAWRRRCSRRWCRITCAPTAGASTGPEGRMIALVGDAELDEGNIFEAHARRLEAGPAQLLVDHRLQPPEPRRRGARRPVGALRAAVPAISAGTW